jgi:hypothetical protein
LADVERQRPIFSSQPAILSASTLPNLQKIDESDNFGASTFIQLVILPNTISLTFKILLFVDAAITPVFLPLEVLCYDSM